MKRRLVLILILPMVALLVVIAVTHSAMAGGGGGRGRYVIEEDGGGVVIEEEAFQLKLEARADDGELACFGRVDGVCSKTLGDVLAGITSKADKMAAIAKQVADAAIAKDVADAARDSARRTDMEQATEAARAAEVWSAATWTTQSYRDAGQDANVVRDAQEFEARRVALAAQVKRDEQAARDAQTARDAQVAQEDQVVRDAVARDAQRVLDAQALREGELLRFAQAARNAGSAQIAQAAAVTLYQHCDYGGYSVRLLPGNYDLHDLERLGVKNEDISSIKFEGGTRAVLYEHGGFQGRSLDLTSDVSCLVNHAFNDILSSIIVWG